MRAIRCERAGVGGEPVAADERQLGVGLVLLLEHRDRGQHPLDPLVGEQLGDAQDQRARGPRS